ncbi:hypothetical protein RA272_28720, partial [Pseudomonas syringae pv. tagetis]|uniref:hypothetical protein n=1 Tax=Pseudomonas syringae group genomosp. 7 TaxID=251699 RepID=UPI00376FABE7
PAPIENPVRTENTAAPPERGPNQTETTKPKGPHPDGTTLTKHAHQHKKNPPNPHNRTNARLQKNPTPPSNPRLSLQTLGELSIQPILNIP